MATSPLCMAGVMEAEIGCFYDLEGGAQAGGDAERGQGFTQSSEDTSEAGE